jgi:hypothetical protein
LCISAATSEQTHSALLRVGQAVATAVGRFVQVGEKIAHENASIGLDMREACSEAKEAGAVIKDQIYATSNKTAASQSTEKTGMIQAANALLNSVTKVLLLADVVVVEQLLDSKSRALRTLNKLENVVDFWSFVEFFTQYGQDLVDLAHLSGERQNVILRTNVLLA